MIAASYALPHLPLNAELQNSDNNRAATTLAAPTAPLDVLNVTIGTLPPVVRPLLASQIPSTPPQRPSATIITLLPTLLALATPDLPRRRLPPSSASAVESRVTRRMRAFPGTTLTVRNWNGKTQQFTPNGKNRQPERLAFVLIHAFTRSTKTPHPTLRI